MIITQSLQYWRITYFELGYGGGDRESFVYISAQRPYTISAILREICPYSSIYGVNELDFSRKKGRVGNWTITPDTPLETKKKQLSVCFIFFIAMEGETMHC